MRKTVGFLVLFFASTTLLAQFTVQFRLIEKSAIKHDSIYIVGTFNGWDSLSNPKYLMQSTGENEKYINLELPAGPLAYKFHRGDWSKVEKEFDANEVADRTILVNRDTIITDTVEAWRDQITLDKKYALQFEPNDEEKVKLMSMIARIYTFYTEFYDIDSGFFYAQKAIDLQQQIISSKKSNLTGEQLERLFRLKEIVASLLHSLGNYSRSLQLRLENLEIAEKWGKGADVAWAINNLVEDYASMKDFESVLKYAFKERDLISTLDNEYRSKDVLTGDNLADIADAYLHLNQLDSALFYAKKREDFLNHLKPNLQPDWFRYLMSNTHLLLAEIFARKGDKQIAKNYYQLAIEKSPSYGGQTVAEAKKGMSEILKMEGKIIEAILLAREAIKYFQENRLNIQSWGENSEFYVAEISPLLANLYHEAGKMDSAYHYLELTTRLRDSLYNADKIRQFQTLTFNEASRQQKLEQARLDAQLEFQNKIKLYGLLTGLTGVILISMLLYRNNRHKQKANALLRSQKLELENTVNELRLTQRQLVQSEKMASLGELTAGIAHEIQNPLNFVNNFSEVNAELFEELEEEIEKGNKREIRVLINDLRENELKIKHHGQRADAIVKSMLQHSRTSSGEKELTDINALCDEYLRLAYHGLRAKDKSFNVIFKTELDPDLPKIDVVPQDIGRVLLNLINNAFHAVSKVENPEVVVSTKKLENTIEIKVSDNGPGIADEIKDKIFQPFFTTKPTGQGTGLGLSLSYDIVKAHGGEIKVSSAIGKGTEFYIHLPAVIID